jgi:hypothetical protein
MCKVNSVCACFCQLFSIELGELVAFFCVCLSTSVLRVYVCACVQMC